MAGFLEEDDYQREKAERRRQKEALDRVTVAIRAAIDRLGSAEAARSFMNDSNILLGGRRPVDVARIDRDGLACVTGVIEGLAAERTNASARPSLGKAA